MWTISELKETGKRAFKANYWPCVLISFLMGLFSGYSGSSAASNSNAEDVDVEALFNGMDQKTQIAVVLAVLGAVLLALVIGFAVKIFLANPITLGGCAFFKSNIWAPASLDLLKTGFQNYWHNFVVLLVRDVYLLLWSLLLIVPGIIKSYSYCMVPYILAEHPELSANEVITRSREMMDGNKGQAFLLDLSFIGWILLTILTLGILQLFWTGPYMYSTHAALYLKLKEQY